MSVAGRCALSILRGYSRIAPTQRGTYRMVRAARALLPRAQWCGTFTTPAGLRMRLDLGTYPDCCMAVGLYELDTYRTLRRLLRPGSWFVDAGANIGYFTLLAAKIIGPAGRIDAYEPDPVNRARLEEHLALNDLAGRVRVHGVALSDRDGQVELYHPDDANHGIASIYASLVPTGTKYTVPTVRMDKHLDGVPDVIKMDIEGAEYIALGGMESLLRSARPPAILMEHNPESCAAAGHTPADIFSRLVEFQPAYQVHWVGWRLVHIRTAAELAAFTRQGNLLIRAEP